MAITKQLVSGLIARGPDAPIDMDEAAQRLTADVIMRFGFDSDYGATDLTKRCAPLEVLQRFLTCMQMRTNPMNSWCPWRKVGWGWPGMLWLYACMYFSGLVLLLYRGHAASQTMQSLNGLCDMSSH